MNIRESDVIFRLGGDEILLLFRNITKADATKVLEKIRHLTYSNEIIGTSTSIGATQIFRADNVETWLNQADDALYEAKQKGRNRVVVHHRVASKSSI